MKTIRISVKAARALLAGCFPEIMSPAERDARNQLEAALSALERKKQKRSPSLRLKSEKKKTKKEGTAEVRAAVMARAAEWARLAYGIGNEPACENCRAYGGPMDLDHMRGRARSETVETCWALCGGPNGCHDRKTRNIPSAEFWLEAFIRHCDNYAHLGPKYGDAAREASKRLAFVETRNALACAPAAPGGGRP